LAIHDVGQQPTPVVYFAARQLGCRSVAVVTASHNPARYNGLKFLVAGRPAIPQLVQELEAGCTTFVPAGPRGTVICHEAGTEYEEWVIRRSGEFNHLVTGLRPVTHGPRGSASHPAGGAGEAVRSQAGAWERGAEPPRWAETSLSVVLDAMSGAFTHIAPRVLACAGVDVTALTPAIDPGYSVRTPNPACDENLLPLIEMVVESDSDLGIALDGDGDRVIFVDHTGRVVRPEQLAVVLIRHFFDRPTVVYDLKCASIVAAAAAARGGRAVMQPSGYGFIRTAMLELRAELGVEVSGHHFFGALDGGDDGLFTALVVLRLLRRTGKRLAELIEPIGWPAITPDLRVPYEGDATTAIESIAASCGGKVSRLDGVRAEYDGGWGLARASITEPAITFRFEGRDASHVRWIAEHFLAGAGELRHQVLEKLKE
jgi:phosphomannomutase/phosphoglucomutase